MKTPEHERLNLRQAFERVFENEEVANIAMKALPPIDYEQLATKSDLSVLETTVEAKFDALRGEMHLAIANRLRTILVMQLATFAGTVAFISRFG